MNYIHTTTHRFINAQLDKEGCGKLSVEFPPEHDGSSSLRKYLKDLQNDYNSGDVEAGTLVTILITNTDIDFTFEAYAKSGEDFFKIDDGVVTLNMSCRPYGGMF